MPLPRRRSHVTPRQRAVISRRIESEERAGVKPSQAKAIAYSEARRRGVPVPPRPRRRTRNPPLGTSATGHILSREVERMEYVHAEDGQPYKHVFKKGTSACVKPDGSVEIYRPDGKPSWEDVDPMLFLTNPPKRRKRSRHHARNKPKRRRHARNRPRARARARKHNAPRRRVRHHRNARMRTINRPRGRKRHRKHNPFAVTHQVHRVNKPRRGHRRGHRRNPPMMQLPRLTLKHFDLKAVGQYIVQGASLGALTFAGRIATGYATALVDLIPGVGNNTAPVEMALQAVASVVVGVVGALFHPVVGVGLMAGGFEGVYDNFIQTYVPSVSTALQLSAGNAATAVSGYARRNRIGAYARRLGGTPLNPAIPTPERKRGFAGYAGSGGPDAASYASNRANEAN